jgi:actin-like ATPase involved in cell morphogenesis
MSSPQVGRGSSLGLTVGATNLACTGDGHRPLIRPSVVTPEPGLTLTGFVDRVGDPVPMVAQNGSRHRPELLLAEALDGVARNAAKAPVSEVAVAVPAHWRASMVEALRAALRSKPGLTGAPLVSDAAAALTALRSNPGLPSAGVIVLCDFGGSGTSITLVDAGAKDIPIGETVRVQDFSGDQIDQAVLTRVVAGIFEASGADPAGTSMVGSLGRLREECRRAKERLSDETATAIVVDVPGLETTVRMTRMELDDLIDEPLTEFVAALSDTLERNRIGLASVSAVATVGGGARIPLITQRLSEHLRTTVVTTPSPQLTAAQGVALIAHRSQIVETATTVAPAAPATATVAAAAFGAGGASPAVGALAWSEVADDPHDVLVTEPHFDDHYAATPADSRPEVHFQHDQEEEPIAAAQSGPVVRTGCGGRRRRRGGVRADGVHAGHLRRAGRYDVGHCARAGTRRRARGPGAASARARAGTCGDDRAGPAPAAGGAGPTTTGTGGRARTGVDGSRPGARGSRS